jgi:hypothetical protein
MYAFLPPPTGIVRIRPTLYRWKECCSNNYLYVLHTGDISNTTPSGVYAGYHNPVQVTIGPVDVIKSTTYWSSGGLCPPCP